LQAFINSIETSDRKNTYPFHTPSAFSFAFWRMNYGASERHFVPNDNSFRFQMMRESVYGGRCEAYAIGVKQAEKYDINSSYPFHALGALLPIPGALDYVTNGSLWNIANMQGMSRITFTQDEYAPFLPTRANNRVYYAVGTYTGTYTHSEIRYALENGLITDVTVEKQYVADDFDNPLHDFMQDCYDKRQTNKVWKMIANSLIGRLCARADGIIEFTPARRGDREPARSLIMRVSEDKYQTPRHLQLHGVAKSAYVRNMPLWAAEVYSLARITLYDAMLRAPKLLYVDTDCIMSDGPTDLEVGELIGQWKKEISETAIYGAKQYTFGEKVIWKGVSNKSEKRREIAFSMYTQERCIDYATGQTAPYSRRELDDGTATRDNGVNGRNSDDMGRNHDSGE
jgi:hypothetical protein